MNQCDSREAFLCGDLTLRYLWHKEKQQMVEPVGSACIIGKEDNVFACSGYDVTKGEGTTVKYIRLLQGGYYGDEIDSRGQKDSLRY
jgi:hypothetical protein